MSPFFFFQAEDGIRDGRVTGVQTCALPILQDAAAAHWSRLAPEGVEGELAWVALRHEIDYLSPAVLADDIVVRTWVGVAEGLSFERFTEMRRRADNRVLARARTLWCPVDAHTGKPRRVSDEIRARCSVPRAD